MMFGGEQRAGSTFATIIGAGGWNAAGYKAYLSLHEDEENPLRSILTNIENGLDSDDSNIDNDEDNNLLSPIPKVSKGFK